MAYEETPWELANALLDAVVAKYADESVSLPELRFVNHGVNVVHDCELVAVSLVSVSGVQDNLLEGSSALRCLVWRQARFAIEIVRCAPVGRAKAGGGYLPPSKDQIEATARMVMADAVLITDAIVAAAYAGDLIDEDVNLALENWASIPEQGGMVGGRMNLRIALV